MQLKLVHRDTAPALGWRVNAKKTPRAKKTPIMLLNRTQRHLKNHLKVWEGENPDPHKLFNVCMCSKESKGALQS